MKQDDGPMRKSNDPKGSGGPNFLLYAGIAGVGVVLVAVLLVNQHRHEIAFPVLQQLLRASKFKSLHSENTGELALNPETGEQYPGKLEISEQRNGQTFTVEYSRLSNLEVSPTEVRGSLQVRTLRPETSALRTEKFRTQLGESEAWKEGLQLLLSNNNIDYRNVPTSPWRAWAPVLFFSLILLVFLVLMLRRIGGAGSPMQFGRSRGKLYAMEDLGVTFDDVAGINEAVEEVRELVDFLQSPEKYQRLGGRIPKGVLLVGPPGTGKTLLAKAIAGEAGVPFYSLSGSDFVEMFVGVGAARVRDMFQQAESKAPCIIFIDELDALGKSRGAGMIGGHDEREQTLNALLVEMDGFDSNAAVIVMAATNRPETLDQALLRPGRFDRHVLVDRPDIQGREDILKVHVKNVKLDNSIDLKEVAGITPGFVGADLANLVNEAALLAARNEKDFVGIHEFNEGVERVTAGLEKKQRVMRREEKERVAYHESGHALVAFSLPNTDPVHKVSIIPRGLAALGYTLQRPEDERFLVTKLELESQIQILLAGTITEEIIYRDISSGAQNDLERATDIARRMVMEYGMSDLGRVNYRAASSSAFLPAGQDEESSRRYSEQTSREIDTEVKRIIDEAIEQVRHILDVRYDALIAVTTRLIEVESIGAKELREIIEKTSPGPVIVPGTDATVDPAPSQRPVDNRSRTEQSG